jgi:serine/threonine protein kinase/Flp pilus assembly protein TadD
MIQTATVPRSLTGEPDESVIAAYEQALRAGPSPAMRDFVPPPAAVNRLATLVELVRGDLEWRWAHGAPKPAADYLSEYPELATVDSARAAVAFEEYRARLCQGESARPSEYRDRYQIATDSWPVKADVESTGPGATVCQSIAAVPSPNFDPGPSRERCGPPWPEVGGEFAGFSLVEELGCGAFGRVFRARQGDLAGRTVALKIGTGLFSESQALAQFQHTNIVPIHSVHRVGMLQAVCMPFVGRTTLAQVVEGLRGQPSLPASGDVLRSTVQQNLSATQPNTAAGPKTTEPASTAPDQAAWAAVARLSFPNAVAWVGAQLAAGLAHAHQRGILHRDLKPANVLLTDDGVPMLLDFNLAEDTKADGPASGSRFGGTLPYMAPEHLSAFARLGGGVDARSDVYSLGVVLYELLTGRRPFPNSQKGPLRVVVEQMLATRGGETPSARAVNPAVPRAIDAVVRKCLAPDPASRYRSAADLQDDLERHLANLPLRHAREPLGRERLRKWVARHPRLCSSATVAIAASLVLVAAGSAGFYARERTRGWEARAALADHRAEMRSLRTALDDRNQSANRPDEAVERCVALLRRYDISPDRPDDGWERGALVRYLPAAERDALREDAGELFYLMARSASVRAQAEPDAGRRAELVRQAADWTEVAERYAGGRLPQSIRAQQADVAAMGGDARPGGTPAAGDSSRDHYLLGAWYAQHGRYREALPHLRMATSLEPEDLPAWFVRGTCHLALDQPEMAALCFGSCVAVDRTFAPAWLNRGVAYSRLRFFDQACDDFDRALRLDPSLTEARVQRSRAREALHDLPGAITDITAALDAGAASTRLYFIRARLRAMAGDAAGDAADRAAGLKRTPTDELSWVARAEARLADDPNGAMADVTEALKLNPASMFGLQLQAHILSERLGKPEEAIYVLDRAVKLYPESAQNVAGRGVLLARAGRRDEAVRDAEEAILRDSRPPNLYQVGCIYALTAKSQAGDKLKAFELLWAALRTGFGLDIVDTDSDLDPVRAEPQFRRLVANARARQAELAK